MKVTKIIPDFTDDRGTISDVFYQNNIEHVAYIKTFSACIRGNHYHKQTTQHMLITKGSLEYWYKDFYNPDDKAKCYIANENDLISTPPFEIHALKISHENHFIVFASGIRGGKDYESDTFRVDPII